MRARDEARVDLNYSCIARFPSGEVEVLIVEVSTGGCRLSSCNLLAQVGATVILELGKLRHTSGEIVWRNGDQCGVRFHRALKIDVLDWLAAR